MRQVARIDDIPDHGWIRVEGDRREIAIYREGARVWAYTAVCPHHHGPLDCEPIVDGVATCPWHGWRFRIDSGEALPPSPNGRIRVYRTEVRAGAVFLDAD